MVCFNRTSPPCVKNKKKRNREQASSEIEFLEVSESQVHEVAVVTTIGAAFGGVGGMLLSIVEGLRLVGRSKIEIQDLCTGILAGLVSVTAGAPWFTYGDAAIIALPSGVLAVALGRGLAYLAIDDVVAAFPVHGFCGVLGTVAVGFFAKPDCAAPVPPGFFYGGDISFVGMQAPSSSNVEMLTSGNLSEREIAKHPRLP